MLPIAILAGGLATRLQPLTERIPKALIEIAGEPFLAHQLRLLERSGVTRVVLCVGHLGEEIRKFAGDGTRFGVTVEYSFDGPRLLGTGGAIRRALPLLGEAFLVLYGDSYLPCDYSAVEEAFLASGKRGLMTVFRNEGRWDASNVEYSEGQVLNYDKVNRTPRMHYIDYGLGGLRASAFERVGETEVCDLAGIYRDLLRQNELAGYEARERFYEIGSRQGIEELESKLTKKSRAVFLDRDGVLNEAIVRDGRPYPPASREEFRIIPGTREVLEKLKAAGFLLIVVTNQPDVARGTQSREAVEELNSVLRTSLPIDAIYTCFHDGADKCECRKPKPGLLRLAAQEWNVDLRRSFLVGDRWRDIDTGAAVGCRTVLIDYGYSEQKPRNPPEFTVKLLKEAVLLIVKSVDPE